MILSLSTKDSDSNITDVKTVSIFIGFSPVLQSNFFGSQALYFQVVAQASVSESRRDRLHRLAVTVAKRYKTEGHSASQVLYKIS